MKVNAHTGMSGHRKKANKRAVLFCLRAVAVKQTRTEAKKQRYQNASHLPDAATRTPATCQIHEGKKQRHNVT